MAGWFASGCLWVGVAFGQDVMTGVRLPLERYESGQVKSQVLAERARVADDQTILGEKVRLETFREDGKPDAVVISDTCTFNKGRQTGVSKSAVRVEREGVLITGTGFEWNGTNGTIKVLSDVRVTFVRAGRVGGVPGTAASAGGEGKVGR